MDELYWGNYNLTKKIITKDQYLFLKGELDYHQQNGTINDEQKDQILDSYQTKLGLNFIKVLLTIGGILVGLGILSFIASNWMQLGKLAKISVILFTYLGFFTASYKTSESYPKTSRGLLYSALLSYGAGIFLIGQTFNFGGHFSSAFLLWTAGVFPAALLFRDKLVYVFALFLVGAYIIGCIEADRYAIGLLVIIPIMLWSFKQFDYSNLVAVSNNLVYLFTIGYLVNEFELSGFYIALIYLLIGSGMHFYPYKHNREVFQIQGLIVFGISGISLTVADIWDDLIVHSNAEIISIIFAICFVLFLLWLTKKENIIALVFICLVILRYYTDTMYDFLPKSIFFIIGGLVLLGFGYYFEKMRKKKGGIVHD